MLGDSDEPSDKMENHADRPEIKDAEISDVGSSIRFSNTVRKNLFYLAVGFGQDPRKDIFDFLSRFMKSRLQSENQD